MNYANLVLSEPAPALLSVALNRPEAANALNKKLAEELSACFSHLPGEVRAVILTGTGEKAFCAGADLKERQGMTPEEWEAQHLAFRSARDAVLASPVPVLAAVGGAAFGGGLELALACDFIYAGEHARFALPEATLGIMPGMGGTQTLPRAIGSRRARELMLTGRPFTAQEALAWGMVNAVYPESELLDETIRTAAAIASAAPLSVRAIRRAIREGEMLPLENAFEKEMREYHQLIPTNDRIEGIRAFAEKRKPSFSGQ